MTESVVRESARNIPFIGQIVFMIGRIIAIIGRKDADSAAGLARPWIFGLTRPDQASPRACGFRTSETSTTLMIISRYQLPILASDTGVQPSRWSG